MGRVVKLRDDAMPPEAIIARALWARQLEVFLARRIRAFLTLSTVSISFNTPLEAQEFRKLLLRRGRGK